MPVSKTMQKVLLLLLTATVLPGCACVAQLQDLQFSLANKQRASSAWSANYSREERHAFGPDFHAGFKKGYYNTAMGLDCRLPPVAPPKYWTAKYQSCNGQRAVQDWFHGYQQGIAAAQAGNCPNYTEIPVSPNAPVVNKTGCGVCYSATCCPTSGINMDQECSGCNSAAGEYLQVVPDGGFNGVEPEASSAKVPVGRPNSAQAYGREKVKVEQDPFIDLPHSHAVIPSTCDVPQGLIGGYGVGAL
jgi:hypothetical protein